MHREAKRMKMINIVAGKAPTLVSGKKATSQSIPPATAMKRVAIHLSKDPKYTVRVASSRRGWS
jgi:hypothetical protein